MTKSSIGYRIEKSFRFWPLPGMTSTATSIVCLWHACPACCNPGVARRRLQLRMAEQRLDRSDIDTAIEEMRIQCNQCYSAPVGESRKSAERHLAIHAFVPSPVCQKHSFDILRRHRRAEQEALDFLAPFGSDLFELLYCLHDRNAKALCQSVGVLVLMVYLIFAMTLYLLPPRLQ